MFRPGQIFESMESEIAKLHPRGQLVDQQLRRRRAEQDLATVAGCQKPRAPIENQTVILTLPQLSLTAMQGHPDFEPHCSRPLLPGKVALQRDSGSARIHGAAADGQDTIAGAPARHLEAAM